jgi:serine/threonine protein phosphatase 1
MNSEDNSLRYVLGTKGNNPLVVLGLNPSTADDKKSDPTVTKVMGFAERAKNDGFMMINLYPLRATDPGNLPKEFNSEHHKANLEAIDTALTDYPEIDVLVAFGGNGIIRSYLKDCLKDIIAIIGKRKVNWYKIGSLTQSGHPKHPSRAKYEDLTPFDIEEYIKKLK